MTAAMAVVALFPVISHAGILSLVSDFMKKPAPAADSAFSYGGNSQNMSLLRAAANPDPNPSKGGGDVIIVEESALLSEGGPAGASYEMESKQTGGRINVYVVREGDSLSQIAEMFDVSSNTIRWANDIGRTEPIYPGQTLVILPISGVRHTVKSGDTLKSIAEAYNGEVADIIRYNGIAEDAPLSVGMELMVPNGEIKRAPDSDRSAPPARSGTRIARGAGPSVSGYYIRPLASATRTQGIHGYNGVDLAAPSGTAIVAAASGEVIVSRSGWNGGYGTYVVIRHPNGTQTLYAHNSKNIVYAGQSVVQGQVIGYVGSTGRSTGPHVHFEVRGAANPF